jgi:hypothetical protein
LTRRGSAERCGILRSFFVAVGARGIDSASPLRAVDPGRMRKDRRARRPCTSVHPVVAGVATRKSTADPEEEPVSGRIALAPIRLDAGHPVVSLLPPPSFSPRRSSSVQYGLDGRTGRARRKAPRVGQYRNPAAASMPYAADNLPAEAWTMVSLLKHPSISPVASIQGRRGYWLKMGSRASGKGQSTRTRRCGWR